MLLTYFTLGRTGGIYNFVEKNFVVLNNGLILALTIFTIIILIQDIKAFSENEDKFIKETTEKGNEYNKLNFIVFILFITSY